MSLFAEQARTTLNELMQTDGVSARELARRTGMTSSTVTRIMKGDRIPSLTTYGRLIAGLGRDVHVHIE
jgi:transcriptional regulator with XRE-family HTH domain